jgi:hypothetical protein
MASPHVSSILSYRGNQFYGSGYILHETTSHGGNIYPHLNNPYHTFVSSQTSASVMIPIQTSMDQLGGGYYLSKQGHGVNHILSWPAMSENQSFPKPWSQITQLTTTSSLVTASHNGNPSPTVVGHVGDLLTTSASNVEDPEPVATSHDGGITLVTMIHIDITSPTSVHHVGDEPLASASHTESMSKTIINDIGGIHTIEKPRRVRRRPKFLCRTCEGNHLTRFCPATVGIPEAWFSLGGPPSSEASMVSSHSVSPLIEKTVMPTQSSHDHTPIF